MERTANDVVEDQWIFNMKLAKLAGIHQVLEPRPRGSVNAYRVAVALQGAFLFATIAPCPFGLYRLRNDVTAAALYVGCVLNFAFSCHKISHVLRHAAALWRCGSVMRSDFARAYQRHDRRVFVEWRGRCARVIVVYVAIVAFATCVWSLSPLLLADRPRVTVRNADWTYSDFRVNVFNLYIPALSSDAYNTHFGAVYAFEIVTVTCFVLTTSTFDTINVVLGLAFSCQLDTVCAAIRSVCDAGNEDATSGLDFTTKYDVYNDLRMITIDHQKIMKKLNDYYNIFRSTMLVQIFVTSSSHISIWFIATMSFNETDKDNSITSMKLCIVLPLFTFQLFMTCALFGTINEKKEAIISALYDSNWTEMDLKSKKLILYMMKMNNANHLKLKFTDNMPVDLMMFTHTMRVCYSVFSMLLNTMKKN